MGKLTRRFNQKARQTSTISNDNTVNKDIEKLVVQNSEDDYKSVQGGSNSFVLLPNKKKTEKCSSGSQKEPKILSNKQKKKLKNIVEQKRKKEKRADVLKSLASCQVSKQELSMYKSTSLLGQKDTPKRKICEEEQQIHNVSSTSKRLRKKQKKSFDRDSVDSTAILPLESDDVDVDDDDSSSESECEIEEDDENDVIKENEPQSHDDDLVCKDRNVSECVEKKKVLDEDDKTMQDCTSTNEKSMENINSLDKHLNIYNNEKVAVGKHALRDDMTSDTKGNNQRMEFKKPVFVEVRRTPEIQTARLLLPILPEEQVIMENIQENDVIVICGSTGSGKTTQIPQFLYEAGYGSHPSRSGIIGVTEPRRVAAISMSKRVAHEMNMSTQKISYQIRYEGNTTDNTVIKFMTDGVLLKEMENDFLLKKYSVIIIDEAHERSVYTDILIGLLSRIVPLRKKQGIPLRLIIMSATLRIEDFTENKQLFKIPPPVVKVDSRQYPVTIHFNRKTIDDYVSEAYKKVCKIHRTLKLDGGILVFLTGQNEVMALCRKLRKTFLKKSSQVPVQRASSKTSKVVKKSKETLPKINLDSYSADMDYDNISDYDDELGSFHSDEDDVNADPNDELDDSVYTAAIDACSPLYVLPLFSLLSTDKQAKVFEEVPEGHRLCVVSTNVAETSLTIPGIKYIVDSGKVKKKFFDKVTGVSMFRIVWTSQASANQRAGRAGRVGPGHCYRLYSSAVFQNDFDEFSEPEICQRPVDDLVLQMKNMCIDKVVNFPFPTPPDVTALQAAEKLLLDLGALKTHKTKQGNELTVISSLGKSLAKIPVSPRFAKMIVLASKHKGCMQYMIAIVAALTVKEIFTDDIDLSKLQDIEVDDFKMKQKLLTIARRKWAGDGPSSHLGDLMVILRAVGACEFSGCSERFCNSNGLRLKAMIEIRKLRAQLTNAVTSLGLSEAFIDPKMKPPTDAQATTIRKIVLSGLADHVARKVPPEDTKSLKVKNAYQCCSTEEHVYIHPTSSLFAVMPEYVVYQDVMETKKLYMKTLLSIQEDWLPVQAAHMCTFGKPLNEPSPTYCKDDGCVKVYMSCNYGPHVWQLPAQPLRYPEGLERYRWFARFLLQGEVVDELKEFSTELLTPASVMVKSWSHLQQKAENLFRALAENKVDNKDKLLRIWKTQPDYLLKQYLEWLPECKRDSLRWKWPPSG